MLSVIMLSVIMLSVMKSNVILLSRVVPVYIIVKIPIAFDWDPHMVVNCVCVDATTFSIMAFTMMTLNLMRHYA
jgi:hypothetical protein